MAALRLYDAVFFCCGVRLAQPVAASPEPRKRAVSNRVVIFLTGADFYEYTVLYWSAAGWRRVFHSFFPNLCPLNLVYRLTLSTCLPIP